MAGSIDSTRRLREAAAVVAVCTLLTPGCATTKIQAQWADPGFRDHPLQGAKVLVVCTADEAAVRHICQDETVARIAAIGAQPLTAPEEVSPTSKAGAADTHALALARGMGAKAVFATSYTRDASIAGPSTTIGIGVGSSTGWGGGSVSVGGIGVSVPVGGAHVESAYGANMTLTEVASGRLMWTIKVSAPSSRDAAVQIRDITRIAVDDAQRAGLF